MEAGHCPVAPSQAQPRRGPSLVLFSAGGRSPLVFWPFFESLPLGVGSPFEGEFSFFSQLYPGCGKGGHPAPIGLAGAVVFPPPRTGIKDFTFGRRTVGGMIFSVPPAADLWRPIFYCYLDRFQCSFQVLPLSPSGLPGSWSLHLFRAWLFPLGPV